MLRELILAIVPLVAFEVHDMCHLVGTSIPMPTVPCSVETGPMAVCVDACYAVYVDEVTFYRADACEAQQQASIDFIDCNEAADAQYALCIALGTPQEQCRLEQQANRLACYMDYEAAMTAAWNDLQANLAQSESDFTSCVTWCCNNV